MKHRTVQRLRLVSRLVFLAFFVFLAVRGRMQPWLPVFAVGVLLSLFFSKFYCGWACQMGTLFLIINWIKTRLRIPQLKIPSVLGKPRVRWIFVVLAISSMVLLKRMGVRADILLWITGLSLVVTLFFHESFWHDHLCPYGTILSLSTRPAKFRMKIDEEACIACVKCETSCPSSTISIVGGDSKKRRISQPDCLVCAVCADVCPVDVIRYGS